MDIIDIMLARAMTPQGQTETYVNIANQAAAKAEKAKDDAEEAIAVVEAAADEIAAAQSEASDLLADAREALETAQAAQINTLDTEDVDEEIKKINVSVNNIDSNNYKQLQVVTTYPDNTLHTENITKLYKSYGDNEDGTMTQKAIKNYMISSLEDKADKSYVQNAIANIPISGGNNGSGNSTITLSTDDAGHIVAVDENGNIIASNITEEQLINVLLNAGNYTARDAVGVDLDYANRTFTRTQGATTLTMGEDFNQFIMYGGRTKCNVADDGTINAFYGDPTYTEDGSNGQVMIYQPKFYYRRTPLLTEKSYKGQIVRHESLILSATEQAGFKLAPIFKGDLEYVLLPAYDASLINSKLASVAGEIPVTNLTVAAAEDYANARGQGWHIVNLAAEATNQMLEIVEFGMMNGQTALEQGIVTNPSANGAECYFITGSTASIGNGIGHAASSQANINNRVYTFNEEGKRAINYRGMENPWGNLWQMIGGVNIYGTGAEVGGEPYICTNFNYTVGEIGSNYESLGFNLPATNKWLNAMGLGKEKYDWVFMPIECSQYANSLLPIGDSIWSTNGLNGINILASGGSYGFGEECGPFYYAVDRDVDNSSRPNYGAKLMYIPTKNAIYEANIEKWNTYMEG